MARHNELGKKGEELAATWFVEKGYDILHRNWKHGPYELDIIARQDNVYHFVEVKTGHRNRYGHPEERIGKKKLQQMMKAAAAWLFRAGISADARIQYDVLAITIQPGAQPEFFLITDVYL